MATLDELDKEILYVLKNEGPMKPRDVARRLGVDGRRVSAKFRKLARLGYVRRLEDGRYEYVAGPEQGQEQ